MKISNLLESLGKLHFIKIGNTGKSICPRVAPDDSDIYKIPGSVQNRHIFVSRWGIIYYGNKTLDTSKYTDVEIGWNLAEMIMK